jgi:type II secretory pathway pseudopilin PulG
MTKNNNILITKRKTRQYAGFSLIEIIAVMVISSMVMISALAILHQVRSGAASINLKLEYEDTADEVLQRIAEDLDRLAAPGFDTTVTIKNKTVSGFNKSLLTIENKFYDKSNKAKTFEKIIWQSDFDELSGTPTLYRHHGGLSLEDKILDGELEAKQAGSKALFIPLCWGMTHFEIFVPSKGRKPVTQWLTATLPTCIAVSISFAEPIENSDGTFEVPEKDRIIRYIAINRTRKPSFTFSMKEFSRPELEKDEEEYDNDPNDSDTDIKSESDDKTEEPEPRESKDKVE